ncbi:high affinity copper uptake protein 1-like isoform X3 [Brienomyrus brachyistius]|uniref:high affinity copper uptake protein 1-like isoform X3 n=1 Tax=Brienomyrus brachyistius TaxID=42636 RepID=UPI0020B30221|nr:high affinity copper uptake protein 1-like isoform X3 [Brienomyrus brachyistius]
MCQCCLGKMDTSQHFNDHHTTISSSAKFSNSGIHRSYLSNVTQSHNLMQKHLQPAMTPAPPSRRQMTFHLDCRALQLLFPGLILNSPAETTLACIAVFLLAVFFEGLKAGCEVLLHGRQTGPGPDTGAVPMPDGSVQTEMQPSASQQMFSLCHLLQATLHITQVVLSQLLMLLFMSYNGYLCTALAAGAGLGFFLFGRKKAAPVGVPAHCRGCSYSADTPPPSL